MVTYVVNDPGRPFLLAADIDGTLLGDDEGESAIRSFLTANRTAVRFAVVTGRARGSVERLISSGQLPQPDYICSSVGTELVDCGDPEDRLGGRWTARVAPGWDVQAIYSAGEGPGVARQEFNHGQPPFQAGFSWDGRQDTLASLRSRLQKLSGFRILPSHGAYIDVLPEGFGKGDAVRFLQQELKVPRDRVVVAGDSGNDREMFETDFPGIIVGNAHEELIALADVDRHYHSPLPAGRGVLDGLRYFGLVSVAS